MTLSIDDLTERADRQDDRPLPAPARSSTTRSSRTAAGWPPSTTSRRSACRPSTSAGRVAILDGTDVEVGTVVGFPHGNATTATKVVETRRALADGRDRDRHGPPDRRPEVRPRRRRPGRYRCGRRRRPRGRRDRQGDLRERLPDRRREDPGLPPDRGRRRRLRQDLDRVRAGRGDPRRPAPHARQHLARTSRSRRPAASGRSMRCSRSWPSA